MARIKGTPKSETLYGTPSSDIIFGRSGNDTLYGRDGNDTLIGGRGNDRLSGGDGNDLIFGGLGNDRAYGGNGNDRLRGNEGRDYLDGGSGNDDLEGGSGDDELLGGKGNDRISGGDGNDRAEGGAGNDVMTGGSHSDSLDGDDGNDRLYGQGGNDVLNGGLGNDLLDGAYGNDTLFGAEGNDTLKGQAGDDHLDGFEGDDKLFGGDGNDLMFGVSGADSLYGEGGDDIMSVGSLLVRAVDGGAGLDLVDLSMLSVDFTGPDGDLFRNIEKIDIGGGNTNQLTFDAQSVIDAAGGGAPGFPASTLLVKGDTADSVRLEGHWTKGATYIGFFGETGAFVSYTSGAAQMLIESEIPVMIGTGTPVFDLGSLDGTNGFTLTGIDGKDHSGFSVSSAGDVNGDGYIDVIVGAPDATSGGNSGESYVVFGKADWSGTPSLDLATLDGSNGFRLASADVDDETGYSVSSAGDINGDGFADLIVGAPGGIGEYGNGPFVVFGKADWSATPTLSLATLDGSNGFHLVTNDGYDVAGRSVSSGGDVNGDGFDDMIVGAPRAGIDPYGSGGSFVVFGKADWSGTPALDLRTLDGTDGFQIPGLGGIDFNGASVSTAGDVNGDGFADLIIGARNDDFGVPYGSGESYVVFGKADWTGTATVDLAALDGTDGFRLKGIDEFDAVGRSVSAIGDVNSDGLADVIIGSNGDSYVVFGKADWSDTPTFDLATLDGTNGFVVNTSGQVSDAGDINGDGRDDFLIGGTFVVYGKSDWTGTPLLDVATLDGSNGFRIDGVDPGDGAGRSVSSAGDVNGDGYGDLVIGAPLAESAGGATDEGESYVVFGGNFTGAVAHVGGSGVDNLVGDSFAESFVGGGGDDILTGNGGKDSFEGGSGNDTIVVGSVLPLRVNGGTGVDTASLAALGGVIDLTGLDSTRFVDIEKVDLGGGGSDVLRLDAQTVFNATGINGDGFDDNTLLVKGDADDFVTLDGTWTKGATISDPLGETGDYVSYVNGQAKVLVESDLTVVTGVTPAIDLQSLDGTNGFTLAGIDGKDRSGRSVSSAGDVNGDGYIDVIVGAPNANAGAGESYLVFGKADWSGTPLVDLATLDGANGVRFFTTDSSFDADLAGYDVSSAGDINGDGFADLIVGAPGNIGQYSNGPYVVFGKADWTGTPAVNLSALDGTDGFHLFSNSGYDVAGRSVSSAGDVNGDGFADMFVGAPSSGVDPYGAGGSYLVFGKADWSGTPALSLRTLDGTDGVSLPGVNGIDFNGASVSSAGDVNGDGFADVIVGANDVVFGSEPYGGGEAYIVFGKEDWSGTSIDILSSLDGTNGFRVVGTEPFEGVGRTVSGGGDVNGDGFADVIVGNYVVFGKADWTGTPTVEPPTLDGTNGFTVTGAGPVYNAGDVNGDGRDDLLVNGIHVVYGKEDWSGAPSLSVGTLDATEGFRIVGIEGGGFPPPSVSAAGDVNGDGFADLIIGAPQEEGPGGATDEGESYVVFGGNFSGAVAHLGGSGADALSGDASAESFVGGGGDDTLTGNGGADSFQGGSGNDVMRVASLDFLVVDGGTGTDTLALDGAGLDLDLTALADSRTRSIERIDVTGSGDNSLTLSVLDVLNLSDLSDELLVAGDAGDTVDQGAGWTAAGSGGGNGNGTSTIDGQTYQIYTAGQATLLVDTDMIVTS